MCSARRLLPLSALCLLIVGCTDVTVPEQTRLSPTPIIEDEAMALRDWPQVPSYYANGSSVAFPIYYVYAPRRDVPNGENIITGPAIFAAQSVALPIAMLIVPPWEEVVYRGVYTPPTYTAVPEIASDATWFEPVKYPIPAPRPR